MEQLQELLQQIQELAGVGIDALKQATGGKGEHKPEGEPPPEREAGPGEGKGEGEPRREFPPKQ